MPQLSFDKAMELHTLKVTVRLDERKVRTFIHIAGTNRAGLDIATASLELVGHHEVELLPALMASVAYGWMYGDAKSAVTSPVHDARSRRTELRRRGA